MPQAHITSGGLINGGPHIRGHISERQDKTYLRNKLLKAIIPVLLRAITLLLPY